MAVDFLFECRSKSSVLQRAALVACNGIPKRMSSHNRGHYHFGVHAFPAKMATTNPNLCNIEETSTGLGQKGHPRSKAVCVCLSVRRSACLSVCLSAYLSAGTQACIHAWMDVRVSVCMYGCVFACLYVCRFVCLPACLPGWLAGWLAG